jgi:hypothetical protein
MLPERRQRPDDRVVSRPWKLTTAAFPALAVVLVEHGAVIER